MATQFSRFLTDDGRSSYQFLLDPLLGSTGGTLLDLCGGSGPLSEAVEKRLGETWNIILLDASVRELEEARKRLRSPRVAITNGLAQHMPLPQGACDVVICHLAMMLMNPLDAVLNEIQRVAQPGGFFICNLLGDFESTLEREVFALFSAYEAAAARAVSWGEPAASSSALFISRVAQAVSWAVVEERPYAVSCMTSPAQLWEFLTPFFQVQYLIEPHYRRELKRRFLHIATEHAGEQGLVRFSIPLVRLVFRTANPLK